jgi:hypothetical protein
MLSRTQIAIIPAAAALILCAPLQQAHAYKYLYGGFGCSGNPYYLEGSEPMTPRCAGGTTLSLMTGTNADIAAGAHWSWQQLNTSAPQIWMTRGPCTTEGISANNTNVEWLASDAFNAGRMTPSVDCGFFGDPKLYSFDIEVNSTQVDKHPDCKTAMFTEDGTWIHELGHAYGQGHFDDWLSTMNTSQVDITSCRNDRSARPSSDAQQAQDNHYRQGLPPAVDVGGSAITVPAGCSLAASGCATSEGTTRFVSTGTFNGNVKFTSMNMRDAWNGSIPVQIFLSQNNFIDSGDIFVGEWLLSPTFAGAIYQYDIGFSFSGSSLVAGVSYCALVRWDPRNDMNEFDESDNVLDTKFCFRR